MYLVQFPSTLLEPLESFCLYDFLKLISSKTSTFFIFFFFIAKENEIFFFFFNAFGYVRTVPIGNFQFYLSD